MEDAWKKFEERRDKMRRSRERKESERKEREREEEWRKRKERRKNLVWRGVEGDSAEKRRRVMEEELGREVRISEVKERKGMTGIILIVRMEKLREK